MLTLTERAIAEIQDILVVHGAPPECGARLMLAGDDQIRWIVDTPRADDLVIDREEAALVLLAPDVTSRLGAAEIDLNVTATTEDDRFVVRRRAPVLCH